MSDHLTNDDTNDVHGEERILKSLLQLLHDVIPLVHRIRHNLEETSLRVPDVTKQLSNVSEATETAAVEILNVLETMTANMTAAQTALAGLKKNEGARLALLTTMSEQIPGLAGSELWKDFRNSYNNAATIAQIDDALVHTNDASLSIAMALQVQDITSQQIAGANHLLEQVEEQLRTAMVQFADAEQGRSSEANQVEAAGSFPANPTAFDSKAVFTKSTARQEEADMITQQFLGL